MMDIQSSLKPPQPRRILFLTPQMPHPPQQGTAIRNFNLIAQVALRHEVALLTFGDPVRGDPGPLAQCCSALRVVSPPVRSSSDRLRTLFLSSQPDMARRLASGEFADALREMLTEWQPDILQVEGIEMAPYAMLARDAGVQHILFDDHNAEYVLQRRAFETDLRHPRRWPAAAYSLVQWQRLRRFERRVCAMANAVVAVSDADAHALQHLVAGLQPTVIPNGVDVDLLRPGSSALPASGEPLARPALVFTGKMDYRPNVDAVIWFVQRVWPLVRAGAPNAHLYVVGKSPHRRLAPLAVDVSITLTGFVPDIAPYYAGADVCLVPLRIGGGTRLKVLEAMAAGVPVVSTRLGAEGLGLTHGVQALLADTPTAFAEAILRLLREPDTAASLCSAAREFVLEHYDWRRIAPRLEAVYARL